MLILVVFLLTAQREQDVDLPQISQAMYDIEEATAEAFDIILSNKVDESV